MERDDAMLNSKDVARILDLSPDTVNEYARKSILPAFKKGRQWRFRRRDIASFKRQLRGRRRPEARAHVPRRRAAHDSGVPMPILEGRPSAPEQALLRVLAPLRPGLRARLLSAHRRGDPRRSNIPPGAQGARGRRRHRAVVRRLSAALPGDRRSTSRPTCSSTRRRRSTRNGWRHLQVMEMDALNLKLPDNTFDYVMAFHVVSVVPDARRMMREVQRVSKPGGHDRGHQPLPQPQPAAGGARRADRADHPPLGLAHAGARTTCSTDVPLELARLQDRRAIAVHDRRRGAQPAARASRRRGRCVRRPARLSDAGGWRSYGMMPWRSSHWASRSLRVHSQRV